MESEIKEKAPRRKLKRVMLKKKKKTDLNTSGSVMYYKKVKAALNVSMNSSRVSQTLKANNKALAQSLQHVKQDLRIALNEIGHLKMENQGLSIRLLSVANQTNVAPQQAVLEGLRAVFNSMSCYVLEMGTCINDGMDLCLASTQQPSHTSTASHPQPMEESKVTDQPEEQDESQSSPRPLQAAEQKDDYGEADGPGDEWEGELYAAGGNHEGLGKMTPDMSIIMEQSVLIDPEKGLASPETCLSAVPEDARSVSDSKNGSKFKKISSFCKLPQRVRIGGSAKSFSNKENAKNSPEPGLRGRTSKTKFGSPQVKNKKSAEHSDAAAAVNCSASSESRPCHRRETFIVERNEEKSVDSPAEMSSTGSIENIADIPMPELVSASPLKDELAREVFEPDTNDHSEQSAQLAGQASTSNAKSSVEETSSQNKLSVDGTGSVSVVTCREKRKSAGKKAVSASTKQSKGSASMAHRSVSRSKKDTEFFVSNPCALNLVHKKVTGSLEGCLDADKPPLEQPASESTVDQFMAHIRESNRSSKTLASFLMVDDPNTSQKSHKSTEIPANVSKSRRSSGASSEPQSEDQTVYFDTDMEFTQLLPQSVNLIDVAERQVKGATENIQKEETKVQLRNRRKGEAALEVDQKTVSNKSKQKVKSSKVQTAEKDGEEVSGDNADSGSDKKLAVALRVNKPGQMVFSASRKEDDGSRKAIPAKLQTKARSKSKKQMEELAKNLPQKEPECIFDFHDKTPRPSVADGKAGQHHDSVFDLSLNDTVPGVGQSLASLREKLKAMNKNGLQSTMGSEEKEEAVSTNKGKDSSSALLGNAPVYSVPLKGDSNEPEPTPRSRGRSSSRSKDSGRQSRSRSRSGNGENNQEVTRRSARSRSRTNQKYTEDDASEDGVASPTSSPKQKIIARGRSRSRVNKDDDDDYKPSSRSQPRGRSRHRQTDEQPSGKEDEVASTTSSPKEKIIARGRSHSRVNKDDDDNKPLRKSQPRGQSQHRQTDEQPSGKEDEVASITSSPKEKIIARGRSRSRVNKDDDDNKPLRKSQPRGRSQHRQTDEQPSGKEDEVASITSSPKEKKITQGRSRSRVNKDDDNKPSSRSQPRGRSQHRQTDEQPSGKEDEVASITSSPKEKKNTQGRSRSRVNKDDDDNKPLKKSQPRGPSHHRQTDEQPSGKEDEVASITSSPKEKNIALGRSRSRVNKDDDDDNKPSSRSQTDEQPSGKEDEVASITSSPKEKNITLGRSRSRVYKDDDDDNKPSSKSQPRGRSHHRQTEEQPTEDKEQEKPLQRGRSKRRVLGDESNKKEEETPIISTLDSQDSAQESRSDSGRNQTKSRSNGLANQEDAEEKLLKGSEDSHQSDSTLGSPQQSSASKHQSRESDKRKVTHEHSESERNVSPSKKLCREKKNISNFEKQEASLEMTKNTKDKSLPDKQKKYSKEGSTGLAVASPLLKKRKSSLPVAMPHAREEEGQTQYSPALAKRKSKSHSKHPEPKLTEKKEKDKHLLDFEVLKQMLDDFDNEECATVDSSALPVPKSRPLVLPVRGAAAPGNKKSSVRSLPGNDSEQTNKKATAASMKGKSQPGSPKTNKGAARLQHAPLVPQTTSAAASPQRTDQRSSQGHFVGMDESSQDGKRAGRRAASSVSYKEPSLNVKLRRGDPHTSFLNKGQMKHIYKSPRTHHKYDMTSVARTALHDLTNVDAE